MFGLEIPRSARNDKAALSDRSGLSDMVARNDRARLSDRAALGDRAAQNDAAERIPGWFGVTAWLEMSGVHLFACNNDNIHCELSGTQLCCTRRTKCQTCRSR